MDVENRIKELVDILNKYSKAYYIDNSPLVSDVEYDRLYKELEDLEKKYPEYTKNFTDFSNMRFLLGLINYKVST